MHVDDTIIGARSARSADAGVSEPTVIKQQPVSEELLRAAARQVGVPDEEPIPQHIRDSAVAIMAAYQSTEQKPTLETMYRRFISDIAADSHAQDVRLAVLGFSSVVETLQTSLKLMREEVEHQGAAIQVAAPEDVWRAFQTHVGSSLDLLDQARDRLEGSMQAYRETIKTTEHTK